MRTRWYQAAWGLGLAAVATLSGCVVAPVDEGYVDYGYRSTTVYTRYGYPPAAPVEYRAVAPSVQHRWVDGDWLWGGSRYQWRPGYWAPPGYRPGPPPHRSMVQPPRPRPHMQAVPRPMPPMARPQPPHHNHTAPPGQRPPAHIGAQPRPAAPQARPGAGAPPPRPAVRPDAGVPRPQRTDRSQAEGARPAPPPRVQGGERRPPAQRRDRDEERR